MVFEVFLKVSRSTTTSAAPMAPSLAPLATSAGCRKRHRLRTASVSPDRAAVSPVEDFERDNAERNTTFIAHTSPVHQDPLELVENGGMGLHSALGHVPSSLQSSLTSPGSFGKDSALGRTPSNLGGGGRCARCLVLVSFTKKTVASQPSILGSNSNPRRGGCSAHRHRGLPAVAPP